MYKLKKEFIGQNVTVFTPDKKVIKLENATQEEFEIVMKIKGNEKFINTGNLSNDEKKAIKEAEAAKKIVKK